jgi:hypothetical protein
VEHCLLAARRSPLAARCSLYPSFMSNPAWQLHAMYTDLRERANRGTSLELLLQLDTPEGHQWWMAAAGLLRRLEDTFEVLRQEGHRVGVYQRQTKNWLSPLTGRGTSGWTVNSSAAQIISTEHLDQLESAASFLDGKVREVGEPGKETLRDVMRRARELLEEDRSLPPYLDKYIHRLLQEIANALDDDVLGLRFDFGDATSRLAVALGAASNASTTKASAWKDVLRDMTTGVGAGLAVEGVVGVARALGMN